MFPVSNYFVSSIFWLIVAKSLDFKTKKFWSLPSSHYRFWVFYNLLSSQRLIFRLFENPVTPQMWSSVWWNVVIIGLHWKLYSILCLVVRPVLTAELSTSELKIIRFWAGSFGTVSLMTSLAHFSSNTEASLPMLHFKRCPFQTQLSKRQWIKCEWLLSLVLGGGHRLYWGFDRWQLGICCVLYRDRPKSLHKKV